jgi:hypothetical protein
LNYSLYPSSLSQKETGTDPGLPGGKKGKTTFREIQEERFQRMKLYIKLFWRKINGIMFLI